MPCDVVMVSLCARYCRIWDDSDEALQPEWEIDPKDLQTLEKARLVCSLQCMASFW